MPDSAICASRSATATRTWSGASCLTQGPHAVVVSPAVIADTITTGVSTPSTSAQPDQPGLEPRISE